MTLDDLISHSTNIVVGRCTATESRWSEDHSHIVTSARYALADDLKGNLSGEIDVETLGGEVGEVGMYVPGMPAFEAGADDLLFLNDRGDRRFDVVGMAQGKFRIAFAASNSAPVVERELAGVELVGPVDARLGRQSFSVFVRSIRSVIR